MDWIVDHARIVLLIAGGLTALMFLQALFPRTLMLQGFGEVPDTATGLLLARNWAMLVGLGGLLVIYAAYHPETRLPILTYSIVGKLSFVGLVLLNWSQFRRRAAAIYAVGDIGLCVLFGWYLLAA